MQPTGGPCYPKTALRTAAFTFILFLLLISTISCMTGQVLDGEFWPTESGKDDDDDDNDNEGYIVDPVINKSVPWPEWVLGHWVWEDESTQKTAIALVQDYTDRGIPVAAMVVGSNWQTGYNTFTFDDKNFPSPKEMVDRIHELGSKVLLWTTPNINVDSPNYEQGLESGYFVNEGQVVNWWKGWGAFIDYFNPDAFDWWHTQVDHTLALEIDGWKCDRTASFLKSWGTVSTAIEDVTPEYYQDTYYRDFFHHTRSVLGNDRIIFAHAVYPQGRPFASPTFAPTDVNFAAWMGDQEPTWHGMQQAYSAMVRSANKGYINLGSDISGYENGQREKTLYIRWAQFGALSPIMENGGRGEHRPWKYDDETFEIYTEYAKLHTALAPYLYSQGAKAYHQGEVLFNPIGDEYSHQYLLGDSLFCTAIMSADSNMFIALPDGDDWFGYFDGIQYPAGAFFTKEFPLNEYPLYVRKGAILPLNLGADSVFTDDETAYQPYTVMIYPANEGSFDVYEHGQGGATVSYTRETKLTLTLTATGRMYAFLIKNTREPIKVSVDPVGDILPAVNMDALRIMEKGWLYDAEKAELWIKPGDANRGLVITVH